MSDKPSTPEQMSAFMRDKRRKCYDIEHPDSCYNSGGYTHCSCYYDGQDCHCCGMNAS